MSQSWTKIKNLIQQLAVQGKPSKHNLTINQVMPLKQSIGDGQLLSSAPAKVGSGFYPRKSTAIWVSTLLDL
jgi:hypothetical protein